MNKIVMVILIVLGLVAFGVYRHYVPLSDGCACNSCCGQESAELVIEEPVEENVVVVNEVNAEARPSDCCSRHTHADEKLNNEK